MYEVEVKARLKDKKVVQDLLKSKGCIFSEELHQVDYIFIPGDSIFPPALGVPVLRVRKENGTSFFTLKIPQSSRQDCIEREFEISDGDKMLEVFHFLGYKQVPTVDKKRIKTMYQGVEIVLDTVENLGDFIEAEKIIDLTKPEERMKVQEELFKFLEEFGIQEEDRVIDGKYDIMLFEKYGMK